MKPLPLCLICLLFSHGSASQVARPIGGEAVVLTCAYGDDPSHATAIMLLAGAESLLKSKDGKAPDLGSWNLDLNMNSGVP